MGAEVIRFLTGKLKLYAAAALAALAFGLYVTLKVMGARIDRLKQTNERLKGYVETRKNLDKITRAPDADTARKRLSERNARKS